MTRPAKFLVENLFRHFHSTLFTRWSGWTRLSVSLPREGPAMQRAPVCPAHSATLESLCMSVLCALQVRLPPEVNRILYVKNLPFRVTADIFGKYGALRQIRMSASPPHPTPHTSIPLSTLHSPLSTQHYTDSP